MRKKKIKDKKILDGEERVLIDKIYILTDEKTRGWFRFWTMEPDEKWYGSWWSSSEVIMSGEKLQELSAQV